MKEAPHLQPVIHYTDIPDVSVPCDLHMHSHACASTSMIVTTRYHSHRLSASQTHLCNKLLSLLSVVTCSWFYCCVGCLTCSGLP